MSDFLVRLEKFLTDRGQSGTFQQLTPDASTREYFRVGWNDSSAVACVYPEAFSAPQKAYLDVTHLFRNSGLPVAEVYDSDESAGVIILEDLGDTILRDVLLGSVVDVRETLIGDAISLIAKIQAATVRAYETGSIASKLKFDREKLLWELEFFRTHYFETFSKNPLSQAENAALLAEFEELAAELESRASVLCHRDFHAANLMLDSRGRLRIIDHQDARIGSATYDLVSLLLDRITEPPSAEWLGEKRGVFLAEREKQGLPSIDPEYFADEFRLQTIQRCLKAIGTFSFQSANRGKTYFVPFIKPMFQIVLRAAENLDGFPELRRVVEERL